MAIARSDGRIYSMADHEKPYNFKPKGLCCGYGLVESELMPGEVVELKDKRRRIKVEIVDAIRPKLTAKLPMASMIKERG